MATVDRGESFGNWGLSLAAMSGAVAGAVGGMALGAEFGTAIPLVWGTLGTMLGSGLLAGGWCLLASLWPVRRAHAEVQHERDQATEPTAISPAPTAG
jgi:hypothetical protein